MRALLLTALTLAAGPALADPCKVIPDKGPTPAAYRSGQTFTGPVEYVGDGDSLCVRTVDGLVEVRLADFRAPELHEPGGLDAKQALADLALGRRVTCRSQGRTYDRVAAACRLNGAALGQSLRRRGARQGGR